MLEIHHQGAVGRGGDERNHGEQGRHGERCPSSLCGDRIEKKAQISNFITEPSQRGAWDQFLVHICVPICKRI